MKGRYTTHEVISMLEDDDEFTEADIYVTPPNDPMCSDEDSGDEENMTVNNLSHRQLKAEAEVTVKRGIGRDRIGGFDESPAVSPHVSIDESTASTATCLVGDEERSNDKCMAPESESSTGADANAAVITEYNTRSSTRKTCTSRSVEPHAASTSESAAAGQRNSTSVAVNKDLSSARKPAASLANNQSAVPVPKCPATKTKVERKWVKEDRPSETVVGSESTNRYADTDSTPTVLFEYFFSDEVIDMLVANTEKYAKVNKGKVSFQTSRGEIRLFLAILFTSGYAPLPRRRLYWEPSDDVHNAAVSSSMTRNRFEELMMCLHVADNENLAPDDRMAKVRPLFTMLNEKFLSAFPYHRHLSVDESMVPYFGRHSAKQFIRGKPVRFGFKVWSLNTPLGYCIQLDPYQGAGVTDSQLGLGGSVVMKLVSTLPTDTYVLFFDNFFTSFRLLQSLVDKNIKATGTVRVNRIEDCPVMSVDQIKKLKRGSYDYSVDQATGIRVTRWHDNSVVTIASNCHGIEPVEKARRWSRAERKTVDITQPFVIGQYNRNMGGVDRMDQNIATYRINIRSKKWWWALFAYLLDVGMQNAWLVYRMTAAAAHRPLDQLDFRRDICMVYYKLFRCEQPSVGRPLGRPKPVSSRVPLAVTNDGINHFLVSSGTQRRCAVCHMKTRRQCQKCDIGLHQECSDAFHA